MNTQLFIRFLDITNRHKLEVMEQCLLPIREAIQQSEARIQKAEEVGDTMMLDAVIDDETEAIENLLGIAFVICQSYITFIVSRVMRFHKDAKAAGTGLQTTLGQKGDIVQYGSSPIAGSEFSEVQVIDAFANYFKHQDEWRGKWEKLTQGRDRTATILLAAGAKQYSTGVFRQGARTLGNESFEDLSSFVSILRRWGNSVLADYKAELLEKGLAEPKPPGRRRKGTSAD